MSGNVAINKALAAARISEIYSETESFLTDAESGYSELIESIEESKGDYIDALKEQLKAEMEMINASCDFFQTLLRMMKKANEDFSSLDDAYAETMK